jgi:phage-related protein
MAENTTHIGISMGLDVSDLKAGLSEANRQIQLANSEFKAASSGMDDWTKSTEGLSAKVKQLDTVLNMQKAKLAGLKAEYEKVAAEQGENSEAARKLKVQINNQQAVVNKTQKEFDNYSETLEQAENGIVDLEKVSVGANGKIKELGESAEKAGDGFTVMKGVMANLISTGITALANGIKNVATSFFSLGESTREARENFNKLETGFTTAGHSAEDATKTYRELYGLLGDEGQATEAASHLALLTNNQEDLSKWTNIATGVYAQFGASLPIENLAEASNETAKTGKLTGGLADALNWAGESETEFQEKLDAASSEQERQALITETLNGLYSEQAKTFKELNGDIMSAREADAALTQALAEMGAVVEPIMTNLKLLAVDLLGVMQPFVSLIGEGLTGVLNGTAGAADTLAQGLNGLLTTLFDKILTGLPVAIETAVSLIASLLPQIITTLGGFLPILIQTLSSQLPVILTTIIDGFSEILLQIGSMLPELIPVVLEAVLTVVETLLDNIDQLIDAGIALLIGLADGLILALPILIDKIPVIIEKLLVAISSNLPKLLQAGIELTVKLAAGLIQAIPQLLSKIPQIITAIVKGFTSYYSKMGNVGLNLVKGIWQGISGGASWLRSKISGFAGNVAKWFKDTFKISSPSKLIEDEVGVYVGQAVIPSSARALSKVKKQLANFSGFVSDNLDGIKGGLAVNASGATNAAGGRSVGGTVINAGVTVHYNGNLSRKQIRQLENDNYTAIKTRLAAEGAI